MYAESSRSGRIHYRINGHGRPVVLIHGVGLDLGMWEAQVTALASRYQVIRYDMLGHGASTAPTPATQLDDFADQLTDLLDELELDQVALIGFSMGGLVAQRFACLYPCKVERLVLMSMVFRRSSEQRRAIQERVQQVAANGPTATVDPTIRRWFSAEFRQGNTEIIEAIRHRLMTNDPQGYLAAYRVFSHAGDESSKRLAAITCPTLVMTGEHDVGSTPKMSTELAAYLPDARVVILPGLRHMAMVEGARQVNAELFDFLEK